MKQLTEEQLRSLLERAYDFGFNMGIGAAGSDPKNLEADKQHDIDLLMTKV